MNFMLNDILNGFNTGIGVVGSLITIYDFFKKKGQACTDEIFAAIRMKSKDAYYAYGEHCKKQIDNIGMPLEEDILGYWESCWNRDVMPSVSDMVSQKIASQEEAEMMFVYLLEAWMEVPAFVEWLHDLLTQQKLDALSKTLMDFQNNIEGISGLAAGIEEQKLRDIAIPISPILIAKEKHLCSQSDIRGYYMVNNGFQAMIRVISAGQDIPHREAGRKVMELSEGGHPVIIAGNGGLGKTSLMMHVAVQWASAGKVVVWLSLSGGNVITEQGAHAFFDCLVAKIPPGQRGLLCIDNPYEGKVSFSNLQKMWPNSHSIQLIMAERANRLTLLADPDRDSLLDWFDDAKMVILQGLKQSRAAFGLKDYVSEQFPETQGRRRRILEKCLSFVMRAGTVEEKDKQDIIRMILNRYGKPNVSLVELIYRTLYELNKMVSKHEAVKLDWEEWDSFLKSEFGEFELYNRNEVYGVIAALKVFHTPITISLFCRYFELKERKLKNALNERLMSRHIEPVIFKDDTLQPKHDVIAELFFLFHKGISINKIMLDLLQFMNKDETETLLANIVVKREFQKGKKYHVGQIRYGDYLDLIYDRMENHRCNLSERGKAYLCLGYLWSRFQRHPSAKDDSLNDILNRIAPEIDGTLVMAKLYTEWGIWARNAGHDRLAEEKFRIVVDNYPNSLPPRTELGKLLSKQKGREKEAEELLREAIKIDPKNLHPHTELGKLLSKQKGREKEAEELLREVISIDARNLHARTVMARLYEDHGRQTEAVGLYQEVCKYDPGNPYGERGLERLRDYWKE